MKKSYLYLLLGLFFSVIFSEIALAQELDDIAANITDSSSSLPGLIAALSYLAGVLVGINAIFKTIDHVTSPTQTPIRIPIIRFFIGGALFALPIITESVLATINGGTVVDFDPNTDAVAILGGLLSTASVIGSLGTNINSLMGTMIDSVDEMPGLVAAVAYLLGMVIVISALYKTRDHVDDPNRVPLKDCVIRFLTAGALFALPTVYEAMYETIQAGGLGLVGGFLGSIFGAVGFFWSTESQSFACGTSLGLPIGSTVGDIMCWAMISSVGFPNFLAAIGYLLGCVLGLWGILKIRDHVNDPSRVALSEGITRLIAGGAFFALPFVVTVFKASVSGPGMFGISFLIFSTAVTTNTTFNSDVGTLLNPCGVANSLDQAMGCFMQDILGPSHVVLNFFAFVAGMIFIMIGISRLIKSAQEGARGPGGIGTFGTFVIGGLLLSATTILRAFSSSLFTSPVTFTYASLNYTAGMSVAEQQAAHNVISAVLQFMIIVGMLSFVRGLFIMRDVAEGGQQASTMSGVTHLVGGALAVNLGPMLNAVQQTLGITAFGVSFGLP